MSHCYTEAKQRFANHRVRKILSRLPARDHELLRAFLGEEKDKDKVCRDIGVDCNYLRVLLHRAKDKFKAVYESQDRRVCPESRHEKFGFAMFEMAEPHRTIPTPLRRTLTMGEVP